MSPTEGAGVTISVVEVWPGRWASMIDGEFPSGQYDPTWGLTTYATAEEARRAGDQERETA